MYRCEVCDKISHPRQVRRTYAVERTVPHRSVVGGKVIESTRREIAREVPCCEGCYTQLREGVPMTTLIRRVGNLKNPQPTVKLNPVSLPIPSRR